MYGFFLDFFPSEGFLVRFCTMKPTGQGSAGYLGEGVLQSFHGRLPGAGSLW